MWNYDNCKKEAIKYHDRFEFQTKEEIDELIKVLQTSENIFKEII